MSPVPVPHHDYYGSSTPTLVEGLAMDQLTQGKVWWQAWLRSLSKGSAGMVVMVVGYCPYLPHVGTSPAIADHRFGPVADKAPPSVAELDPVATALKAALSLSVGDQARELLAALSLNKTQLAEVLGVSRPTLYDWLDGKEPNAENCQRLTTILRLLGAIGVSSEKPLALRMVRQGLADNGVSILQALSADRLDENLILDLVREAKKLGSIAESRRITREERLRALGFEEPTDAQRREQLARNLAGRDWPKP